MPEPLIISNCMRDPYGFEELIKQQDKIFNGVTALDLSQVTFIEPYSMLSLILMGRAYLRSNGARLRLVNIPINILQYLHRMDFIKAGIFDISERLPDNMMLKRISFSRSVMEITEIPNKERESIKVIGNVIGVFRKRASHILRLWLSQNIVDYFVTAISELSQNIFEHSLDSGFIAMQTYSTGRENIVRLVISDSGIGIVKSFENIDVDYTTPADLIKKALITPISSKRKNGYGLCQVNSIMERLRGDIYIRSGNASVSFLLSKKSKGASYLFEKDDIEYFGGTQISLSLTA